MNPGACDDPGAVRPPTTGLCRCGGKRGPDRLRCRGYVPARIDGLRTVSGAPLGNRPLGTVTDGEPVEICTYLRTTGLPPSGVAF